MTRHQQQEARAHYLGALLREAADKMAELPPLRGEGMLLARVAAERRGFARNRKVSQSSNSFRVVLAAAALALTIAGLLWRDVMPGRPITYEVDGGDVVAGGYITAPPYEQVIVDFSDGSEVTLSPDARVRVQSTHPNGAVLVLERGSTQIYVKHQPETRWQLWAGPYEVDVVGTRFSTDWDPSREELQVDVETGAVRATGGAMEDPVLVHTGQRLTASTREGAWTVGQNPKTAVDQQGEPSDGAAGAQGSDTSGPSRANPGTKARTLDWAQAIARGDFDEVVASARATGIQRCLDACSPADLRRLADAARYTNRYALAKETLSALRRRDPKQRAVAAYLLGTVSEPQGRLEVALTYHNIYLHEAPQGKYAQEARLARMRILDAQGNTGAARNAARDYLVRYPKGAGTKLARQILNQSPGASVEPGGFASTRGGTTHPAKRSGGPSGGSR